ncbi:MAG: hypothetical protein ACJ0FF_00095 [Gammaproteobacteria bacterium]
MTKKHQLNIITAQPTLKQKKWGFTCPLETKSFKDGKEVYQTYIDKNGKIQKSHPTYYSSRIIEWNNLKQLYKELKPYILGTRKDAEYSSLMYGTFRDGSEDMNGFQRLNVNVEDTHHRYLILDIETDSPSYKETCLNIHKVREWLIDSYPWITEETGMILYQTASAGVIQNGKEKHKQIRIRAIMELSVCLPGLNESERKHTLRPWMKQPGGLNFQRHIDSSTHEKARKFYLSPPKLTRTERILTDDICCLHEGLPVEYDILLIDFDTGEPHSARQEKGVSSASATFDKEIDGQKLTKELREKPPQYWWDKIADENRYKGHYRMLVSAYFRNEIKTWRDKLLADSLKLGDKTEESIDSVIEYIERKVVKDYDKPTDKINNHNVIDIPIHELKYWDGSIQWKEKGVILQKLYEGAGKTESLKELVAMAKENNKSFLYVAPNTKTVINESEKLGLSSYKSVNVADIKMPLAESSSNPKPANPFLGICYPSLEKMKGQTPGTIKRGLEWDIVVMDEIEQLLIFGVHGGGCIMNPELANGILRQLVEKAELVVGMDARLTNLSLQALEHWRVEDKVFDIYTQSKIKPWNTKTFTMVDSTEMAINYVREAVAKGKRVAVVSELDRSGKRNLESLKDYIEEQTGKKGWAIDQKNKDDNESRRYIDKLGSWTDKGKEIMGELAKDLKEGKISHIWASPVIQSAWSYKSEEAPFDLVVGLYPNSVLTAPNIVQHISRFRTSTEYVLYVNQTKKFRPFDIYQRMYPKVLEGDIDLGLGEFNKRHEMHDYWEDIQKQNRQAHLIEMIESRGGEIEYDHTRIIEKDRELARWLEKNREEAWKMVRSKEMWNMYQDLIDQGELEEQKVKENIYDI